MTPSAPLPATITQPTPQEMVLSWHWRAQCVGALVARLPLLQFAPATPVVADAARIESLDASGAWLLQTLLLRLQHEGAAPTLTGLRAEFAPLLEAVAQRLTGQEPSRNTEHRHSPGVLAALGQATLQALRSGMLALDFIGGCALALAGWAMHPSRIRGRPILVNIRSGG